MSRPVSTPSTALEQLRAGSNQRPHRLGLCVKCGAPSEVLIQVMIREKDRSGESGSRKYLKTRSRVVCAECAVAAFDRAWEGFLDA